MTELNGCISLDPCLNDEKELFDSLILFSESDDLNYKDRQIESQEKVTQFIDESHRSIVNISYSCPNQEDQLQPDNHANRTSHTNQNNSNRTICTFDQILDSELSNQINEFNQNETPQTSQFHRQYPINRVDNQAYHLNQNTIIYPQINNHPYFQFASSYSDSDCVLVEPLINNSPYYRPNYNHPLNNRRYQPLQFYDLQASKQRANGKRAFSQVDQNQLPSNQSVNQGKVLNQLNEQLGNPSESERQALNLLVQKQQLDNPPENENQLSNQLNQLSNNQQENERAQQSDNQQRTNRKRVSRQTNKDQFPFNLAVNKRQVPNQSNRNQISNNQENESQLPNQSQNFEIDLDFDYLFAKESNRQTSANPSTSNRIKKARKSSDDYIRMVEYEKQITSEFKYTIKNYRSINSLDRFAREYDITTNSELVNKLEAQMKRIQAKAKLQKKIRSKKNESMNIGLNAIVSKSRFKLVEERIYKQKQRILKLESKIKKFKKT